MLLFDSCRRLLPRKAPLTEIVPGRDRNRFEREDSIFNNGVIVIVNNNNHDIPLLLPLLLGVSIVAGVGMHEDREGGRAGSTGGPVSLGLETHA